MILEKGRRSKSNGFRSALKREAQYVVTVKCRALEVQSQAMSASARRSLFFACLPPLVMAALLSRWFLLLLLMPAAALLYSRLLAFRRTAGRCLACGFDLGTAKGPSRCPRCGVDITQFVGNPAAGDETREMTLPQVQHQTSADEPFEWPANVELEAIVSTDVKLPGDILGNDEIFDSVIQVSDSNAKITFEPGGDSSIFRSISIRLEPGARLKLTKSTTA
jgi:hypothetical protein